MLGFRFNMRQPPVPPAHGATEWFVSTAGVATNAGTQASPWDWLTALHGPPMVQPGDTITFLGGTYGTGTTTVTTNIAGAVGNPITVRGQPGARVTLNLQSLVIGGQYTWYRDMEVCCLSTTTTPAPTSDLIATQSAGDGIKLINLVVHDAWGVGISPQSEVADHEVYGCLVYNNGGSTTLAPTYGHGIYPHGTTTGGTSRAIRQNIIFNNVGYGLHAFADTGTLANLDIEQNCAFGNGLGEGIDLLVGGQTALSNLTCTGNVALRTDGNPTASFGYLANDDPGASNVSGIVSNNYCAGMVSVANWDGGTLTFTGNTCVAAGDQAIKLQYKGTLDITGWTFDNNAYAQSGSPYGEFELDQNAGTTTAAYDTIAEWRAATGVDTHSTFSATSNLGTQSWCVANVYTPGRGHIYVHNPSSAASVAVDLSPVLVPGDTYALYHVYDPYGTPTQTGTYAGGTVTVTMTGLGKTPPSVLHDTGVTPAAALPVIGAFILLKTGHTTTGWNAISVPHSSTGLLFAYTDFSTQYQTGSAPATQQAFINTHADKVMSGGEPAGGYQAGVVHQPYILTFFVPSDGSKIAFITNTELAWQSWAVTNGYTEEEGYLHYAAGQTWVGGGTATGNGSKAERYVFSIAGFPPARWMINCRNPGRIAFETWRAQQILTNAQTTTSYTPQGIYVDEAAEGNFNIPAGAATLEYGPSSGDAFYSDVAALLRAVRAGITAGPWGYEIGGASYIGTRTAANVQAAGADQYEQGMNLHVGNAWPGSSQTFVVQQLAAGVAVECVTPWFPTDTVPGGAGSNYGSDPVPTSCHDAGNIRLMMSCFAVCLGFIDPVGQPGRLALNVWNGGWTLPTANTGGIDFKWPVGFQADLGYPTGAQILAVSGVVDRAGQPVAIWTRQFANGLVVYRGVSGYTTTDFSSAATYIWTAPSSTGPTGTWQRIRSDGTLAAPATQFGFAPAEGILLVPA